MVMKISPAGENTRWGTWYPVRGHESVGYTFKIIRTDEAFCQKCNVRTDSQHGYAVMVYWRDDWALWCMSCWASWCAVNEVLLYGSNAPLDFDEKE